MPQKRIWYPTKTFVIKAHEIMLEKFGGRPGFDRFIKNIWFYNIDEIEAWLRNGQVPQEADSCSEEKCE